MICMGASELLQKKKSSARKSLTSNEKKIDIQSSVRTTFWPFWHLKPASRSGKRVFLTGIASELWLNIEI